MATDFRNFSWQHAPLFWDDRLLIPALVVFFAAVVLPVVYSIIFYDEWNLLSLPPRYAQHLMLNLTCNMIVIVAACSARGHMEEAIGRILALVFIVHSILLVLIISWRLYYSRPVLLGSLLTSVACGVGIIWLMQRLYRRRITVIEHGLTGEMQRWLGPDVEVTRDPSDLRNYDLILVNFEEGLPSPWAKAVSSAILSGAQVSHTEEYLERSHGGVDPEYFSVDHLNASRIFGFYPAAKRAMDIVITLLILPAVTLILAAAILGIILSMGRPIFFVQDRVGEGGKIFCMYKLRTMRQRRPDEPVCATARNDDRITPLGWLLRRTHCDELPQVWNVLKGDMSLIGPRPEQPQLALCYAECIPAYPLRHLVRPGITGWSQVCFGYAGNMQETREKLTYDLHYIKYCSLTLDLRIAMFTLGRLFDETWHR